MIGEEITHYANARGSTNHGIFYKEEYWEMRLEKGAWVYIIFMICILVLIFSAIGIYWQGIKLGNDTIIFKIKQ